MRQSLILLFLLVSQMAMAANKPNLIVMMTDDQRFDMMSCAGSKFLKTPNMDRIANEGARCMNMFVTNALCAPSRATLLSGLYSHANGVLDNNDRQIPANIKLLPDYLREAGYEVAFCGKSHIKGALRDRKWDYYFGFNGQGIYMNPRIAEGTDGKDTVREGWMDDIVTGKAIEWVKKKREKPFCLFLFFKAPHRSWVPAPRHKEIFKNTVIQLPDTYDDDKKGYPGKPQAFVKADNKVGNAADTQSIEQMIKDYASTLVGVDENVGRLLDALTETKQLDETAIFYTSDNGFFLGEYHLYDKRLMHEPSIRVPMLVRYPRLVKAGFKPKQMILNIDIAPTLLELAGVEKPAAMHGRSFLPVVSGKKVEWRKDWLYSYYEYPGVHDVRKNRGVRTDRYKLIHYYEDPEEFELYDLQQDPSEKNNLYGKPQFESLAKQLKERMTVLRRDVGDTP